MLTYFKGEFMKKLLFLALSVLSVSAFADNNGYPQQQLYTGNVKVTNPDFEKSGSVSNCDVSLPGASADSSNQSNCSHENKTDLNKKANQKSVSKYDYEVDP